MALEKPPYQLHRWMQDLPSDVKSCPIIFIAIPGSHNTFSYSISKSSSVSPDAPDTVKFLSHIAKPIVNPFIYKWSRTQTYTILDQLQHGIRYLDIRVASYHNTAFVCHGLFGGPLIPYLKQILLFLNCNKEEVVILDFQHFYNFSIRDHNNLISELSFIFGEKMCHVVGIKYISIINLLQNNKQIIVIYRNNNGLPWPFLWPSNALPTPWPNKVKISDLENFLNYTLANRNNDVGNVTQCVLTVDTKYVIQHPCLSLKTMASKTNSKIASWLKTHNAGAGGFNIIICDFVQDNDFIKNVVELNYKRN